MARALYGVASNVSQTRIWSGVKPFEAKLEANFIQPDWFRQQSSGRIVVSGMFVPEFLELRFIWGTSQALDESKKSLRISKIGIELQELLSAKDYDEDRISFDTRSSVLRKMKIFERTFKDTILNVEDSSSGCEAKIPSSLFGCKLPNLGPTYFTNSSSRCYAIKVSIDLGWKESERIMSSSILLDISVAEQRFRCFERRDPSTDSSFSTMTLCRSSNMVMERFSHSLFIPSRIARNVFSMDMSTVYLSHQTDTFRVENDILTVTKIDMSSPCKSDTEKTRQFFESLERNRVVHLGKGPVFKKDEMVVVCEVVESSKLHPEATPGELAGDLFLRLNGNRVKYVVPLNNPLYKLQIEDMRVDKFPVPIADAAFFLDFSLAARFRKHRLFKQARGDRIVLPGMRVPDFLSLEFQLPFPIEEAESFGRTITHLELRLVKVCVWIKETILSNTPQFQVMSTKTHELFNKDFNVAGQWKYFRPSLHKQISMLKLPTKCYDCLLPELGPTFISNEIYRSYEVMASVFVRFNGDSRKLSVRLKVKVAKADYRYLDARSYPPPY